MYKYRDWIQSDKIHWDYLSENINAIHNII